MSDKLDAQVMELFEVVNKRREEIEKDEEALKAKWLTTCSLTLPNRTTPLNIQTAKEDALRTAAIELLTLEDMSVKADTLFGLKVSDKYQGFTYDAWKKDLIRRMTALKLKEKKDELTETEKSLNLIVSPEQRRRLELERITKSLGLKTSD